MEEVDCKCRTSFLSLLRQEETNYVRFLASLIAQLVKNPLQRRRPWLDSWVGKSAGEGIGYPLWYSWASLVAQMVKNPPAIWET